MSNLRSAPLLVPSRRTLLGAGLGTGLLAGLAACGNSAGGGGSSTAGIRMSVYGSETRQEKLRQVFELYTTKYTRDVSLEAIANDAYTQKITTEVTGGAAPDAITMFHNTVADYARRSVWGDLDAQSGVLDVGTLDEKAASSGILDDKRVVVPLGDNAYGIIWDEGALTSIGMAVPEPGQTWEQFASFAIDVSRKKGPGYFGTIDMSGDLNAFQIWARQRGQQLYTDDHQIAFTSDDLTSWFEFWDDLRTNGGAPPMDQTSEAATGGFGNALLVMGKAANFSIFVNVLNAFQALTQSPLALSTPPMDDPSQSGLYVRASNWIGLFGRSEQQEAGAQLIDLMLNDEEAATVLGAEFGAPPNLDLRAGMTFEGPAQQFVDYVDMVGSEFAGQELPKLDVEFPAGSAQIQTAFQTTSQNIGNGSDTIDAAVDSFISQAEGFLTS